MEGPSSYNLRPHQHPDEKASNINPPFDLLFEALDAVEVLLESQVD